jgi:hypothetical protein
LLTIFVKEFKTTNKREIILEFSFSVILREKTNIRKKYYALEKLFISIYLFKKPRRKGEKPDN